MTGHYEHVFECGFECIMELEYEATKGRGATHESPPEAAELGVIDIKCVEIEGGYTREKHGRLFLAVEEIFDEYYEKNHGDIDQGIWQRIQEEAEHCE